MKTIGNRYVVVDLEATSTGSKAKVALLDQATRLDKKFCNLNKVLTWSVKSF